MRLSIRYYSDTCCAWCPGTSLPQGHTILLLVCCFLLVGRNSSSCIFLKTCFFQAAANWQKEIFQRWTSLVPFSKVSELQKQNHSWVFRCTGCSETLKWVEISDETVEHTHSLPLINYTLHGLLQPVKCLIFEIFIENKQCCLTTLSRLYFNYGHSFFIFTSHGGWSTH